MSKLKQLVSEYANQDKNIPVEYYTVIGSIIKGVIQRVDDDGAVVWGGGLSAPMRVKINVTGMAGVANPQEWCLTREARDRYNALNTTHADEQRQAKLVMVTEAFGKIKSQSNDVNFHYVDQWKGLYSSEIAGFVSFNLTDPEHPIAGFLIYLDGRMRYVHAVPLEVKLTPM
ncbi:hypothetical protein D3C87_1150080 [compost metagenome]